MSNPLDHLLSYAHRSYVRMEAEQLIGECLELEDVSPFNNMLEKLVLAGTTSLFLLREVLEEVISARTDLDQEGLGVRQDLMDALKEFGVNVPELLYAEGPDSFRKIYNRAIEDQVQADSSSLRAGDEVLLREICAEASDRVMVIARKVALLHSLEEAVRDWMGSLAYELMHSEEGPLGSMGKEVLH